MAELKNITVNIEINGTLDEDVIAEEVKYHLRREVARIKASESKFLKVGDYAKVTQAAREYRVGDIIRISEVLNPASSFDFKVEKIACSFAINGDSGYVCKKDIQKVTDQEVAEVKKWAKIGRKPNEFKEGDFIKYKKCIAEVTRVGIHDMSIEAPNGIIPIQFESAKLVSPVEARFDL